MEAQLILACKGKKANSVIVNILLAIGVHEARAINIYTGGSNYRNPKSFLN